MSTIQPASSDLESERFRLARAVRAAVLGVPGVVGTDVGPSGVCVTSERGERLEGILCMAAAGGAYDVTLRLVCSLVPLEALAEQVRDSARQAADAGQPQLGRIDVQVADVVESLAS